MQTNSYPSVLTLQLHSQLKWQFDISVKGGGGESCPQCAPVKASKGVFCQVLFFQTFLSESVKLIYRGFLLIYQLEKFDSFWLSRFKLCDCVGPSVQS